MSASGAALHLVVGDDEFLVSRTVAAVTAQIRAAEADVVVEKLTATEASVGDLLAALSPSLFGGRRVVVIFDGQDARKELAAAILSYVAAPDPEVVLVVTHAGGAKGKALADGLRSAGAAVVNAAKLKGKERNEFVRDEVRRLGGKASEAAAQALVDALGSNLRDLAAACQQLVADTGGRIEVDTVLRYYRGRAEISGFTVAEAAMSGNLPAALEALRWALQTGVDPVPIADALADGVRTVSRVASAGRGNAYQLAATLGMPNWKVDKVQKQARGWTSETLVKATQVVATCNVDVRGGADDRAYALERAVFELVSLRRAGGGG